MFYIVLIGMPALLVAGGIWFLADMRERDEVLTRLRKVQAEKRKLFQATLPGVAAPDEWPRRKRKPAFGLRG